MKNIFLILCLCCVIPTYAQQQDSVSFIHQEWQQQQIKKGIVWKKGLFSSLFDSRQAINIIEVDYKKYRKKLQLAGLPSSLETTATLAKQNQAIVAINGGFFDMKNGGAVDYLKIDDVVVNDSKSTHKRANAQFSFDKKDVTITSSDVNNPDQKPNVMVSGPLLIDKASIIQLEPSPFNDNRHPRTAIGIKNDKLIFLVVDGRNASAQGMNLIELSKILKWYGCQYAMNLDGGGSTTMYIDGQPFDGIVNYPSDNKVFDHLGQRKVANIIYIQN